ncbi:hypothetical protein ILUMI_20402 [Ignelater luminosus]|uniref:long-chain-fatty-acid--CoA ligase n=1 Tax=Ignelater luminosus TaxID=2038154 RepID=A0A8K0CI93_IGNLU|nr:hypothetical protein ILUMI_20402 [Ignelater luminosus]
MDLQNSCIGPEMILPATTLSTSKPNEPVLLRIPKQGKAIETVKPISVPGLLHRTASRYPNHPALYWKDATTKKWKSINYSEYEKQVRTCAKAFLQLGLERYHSVCILGFNSPEWFMSSLGAIYAGGISAGIYTTNSSEACLHCAELGKANIAVVQDSIQLQKIQQIKNKLPHLKAIIQYEGEPSDPSVLSWKQLMELGKAQDDDKLDNVLKQIAINECCMLIFTSGTVGNPKGVMISHDNVTWTAVAVAERLCAEKGKDRIISYLPLSHVAAQIVDIFIATTIAASVYFANKDALKGSLVNTMLEVHPTYFLGVPRVWEKIHEKMIYIGQKSGSLKKAIANWAKYHAFQHNMSKINGTNSHTWNYASAKWLVLKRIKQALGLDQCKYCISAAAPLSANIKEYFMSIDIPVMEVFGMSESSGPHTLSTYDTFNLDSVGPTLSGTKTKIFEGDKQSDGEICVYGRHVFMGYIEDPEKTAEAVDKEGWLHSGDVGHIDNHGFVYITGRIKELLITAGGENIPPVLIEQSVKQELPYVSNALLIGDKRKYLAILLALKTEVNSDAVPLDNLTSDVQKWLQSLGCPADTVTQVLNGGVDKRLLKAIQDKIDIVNEKATSNAQRIRKFAILPADFSITTGELGPTMKVRRNIVITKYADIIEKLYT